MNGVGMSRCFGTGIAATLMLVAAATSSPGPARADSGGLLSGLPDQTRKQVEADCYWQKRSGDDAYRTCLEEALRKRGLSTKAAAAPTAPKAATVTGGGATAAAHSLARRDLVDQFERATVFVFGVGEAVRTVDGVKVKQAFASSGSGFFVTPTLIMTNAHVVQEMRQLIVVNRAMGRARRVRVHARSANRGTGDHDYAMLAVDGYSSPDVITFASPPEVLAPVFAFGFPGLAIADDRAYEDFMSGDTSAVPAVVATTGEVQSLRSNRFNPDTILHNSEISPGNSGGPLADSCGRVVGINTYGIVKGAAYEVSLSSREVTEFLTSRGVPYARSDTACSE